MRFLFALFFVFSLVFGAGISTLKSNVLNGKDVGDAMSELISRCESGNAGACGAIGEIAAKQGDKKFADKYLKKSCDLGGNCSCYENFKAGRAVKSCEVKFAKNSQKSAPKKSASQTSKDEAKLEAMINSGKIESQSALFSELDSLPEQKPDVAEDPKSAPANNSNLNTSSNLKSEQSPQKSQTTTSKSKKSESESWAEYIIPGLVLLYLLYKFAAWGFWLCAIGAVIAFFAGKPGILVICIGGVILFANLASIGSGITNYYINKIDWENKKIIIKEIKRKSFGSDEVVDTYVINFSELLSVSLREKQDESYIETNDKGEQKIKKKITQNWGVILYYQDGDSDASWTIGCDTLGEALNIMKRLEKEIENNSNLKG